ncbi:MAG: CheY-like chemotaxis protein [Paracoccaceae bacterium]|jgi:CheY-like chemotaxis protein
MQYYHSYGKSFEYSKMIKLNNSMNNYKVLIAEDNTLLANLISTILTGLHIANTMVMSGKDVIPAYEADYFDMILLDIMMPEMSGLEISKEIRKTDTHTPIVAFTSLTFDEIKDDLAASGINHYISKPSKLKELKILLKQYFKTAA